MPRTKDSYAEELFDSYQRGISDALTRALQLGGETPATLAGWAGVTEDAAKAWVGHKGSKVSKVSLAHVLVVLKRSKGPFREVLLEYLRRQTGGPRAPK